MAIQLFLETLNVKCGEIDIIAIDQNQKESEIVFVEVKSRIDTRCGNPAEAINMYKMRHIYRVAEYYLMINHLENHFARFDVVEVYYDDENGFKPKQINHIENAFYGEI